MQKLDLGQIVSILANVGVIAGIVFLAFELRQNTIATQIAAAESIAQSSGELYLEIFRDRELAELYNRTLSGEKLDAIDRGRMQIHSAQVLRVWASLYFNYRRGVIDEELWKPQLRDIESVLQNNSVMREWWNTRSRDGFSDEFVQLIDSVLEQHPAE